MRTKLLILPVIMMMGLAVSAPVSADTTDPTRVEIVTQGDQKIQSLWNQYQQALQEREDAWNQGQGNRFTPAYITADAKAQLSGIIGKFLRTPIRERFPEKKYRLRWIDDDVGEAFLGLYGKTEDYPDPHWILLGASSLDAIFTESELEQLKKDNPRLAPAIDAMKEEVKDDD